MKRNYILMEIIILFIIVCSSIIYQQSKKDSISLEENQETILSLTIDGVISENFPNKASGKTIESIECDNGAVGSWDYESWGPMIRNVSKNRTKCQFNFVTKYHENILNGMDPVLKEGLIPVTIDNDGTVHKAYLGRQWYKYQEQRWANAVILEDESKKYYEGDIIPEENIESYFVWIPKYRYKLFDLGNYTGLTSIQNKVQTIDVIFGEYNTKDSVSGECKTPGVSGESGNCKVGDYMTHPAFLSFGTKGLWIGKFETGYKGATTTTEAQQNVNNTEKVEMKPNVYSWTSINVANAHLNSYNYKREYDSHLMKNTEWGAIAYLQHSIYGSRQRIRLNNNNSFITGYSAVNEPTCGWTDDNRDCNICESTNLNQDGTYTKRYHTEVGYLASTTANISGIYDMSGGSWEYTMAVMLCTNGEPCAGRDSSDTSGFSGTYSFTDGVATGISFPDKKYYDTYPNSIDEGHFNYRILGDATGEMGPFSTSTFADKTRQINSWYDNQSWFPCTNEPWLTRGGGRAMGTGAGIFSFDQRTGSLVNGIGFRTVLAI